MSVTMKKILLPILCIAICAATIFFFFIPAPSVACFAVGLAAAGLPPIVAMGFKDRGKDKFLWLLPFYRKFVVGLFIVTDIVIPLLVEPACKHIFFFLFSGSLLNSILYTVKVFRPGLLQIEQQGQCCEEDHP